MKILQINRNYFLGGAAIVGYRLHNYINNKTDSKSYIYCRFKNTDDKNVKQFYEGLSGRIISVAIDRIERITGLQYFFQRSFDYIANDEWFKSADLVHFHITHSGYINQWFLAEVAKYKPVVWTLHDTWAIAGRCAHSFDCERWKIGCGRCPYKTAYPPSFIDTSAFLWKLKKNLYSKIKVNIVTPSLWLQNMLPNSILSHCNSTVIRNAVDTDTFKPYDKLLLRKSLNIPENRFVILFVAHGGITAHRKGFRYLENALKNIHRKGLRPFLVTVGDSKKVNFKKLGLEGLCTGKISSELLLTHYYAAVDCFVLPSVYDNAPLTIIESLACGTPVIAFKVGGIPEMIEHKQTGYLAAVKDVKELAEGIQWLMSLGNNECNTISQWCRETALREYSLKNQAKKYMNLYSSIIK